MSDLQTGLFQGACYYKADDGTASIMAAIGGHLWQIIPDTGTAAAFSDLSIPGNPNPADIVQAWLFQAENYLIYNDGVSIPLIYDGATTFRTNNGSQAVLGVTAADFTVPAIGSQVTATLNQPFTGNLGQSVIIGSATYQTVGASRFSGYLHRKPYQCH